MSNQQDNLAIWNEVEATDPDFTKQFNRGGGFKGTATNATYLIKKATKMFGPIGIGWGWTIIEEKIVDGAVHKDHTDLIHVLKLKLWYEWNGKRGEIEHFGQTQFVGKNTRGVYTDEEAPKKSLTDALTKSLSTLGFAADIHLGLYDDNRYVNDLKRNFGDEFEGRSNANDNDRGRDDRADDRGSSSKDEKPGKRKASVSEKEQDEILDKWEGTIKSAKTVKSVMEAIANAEFAPDMEKLHEDDEKYIRDLASKKSQELKTAKTKDAPKDADAA